MNHEQVLVTLYDLMLTLSGEVKVESLTANFLRRLLYHTGFACGVMVRIEAADEHGRVPVKVCQALGNRELVQRVGQSLTLPAARVLGDSTCIDQLDTPIGLFLDSQRYPCMLRLRIGKLGAVLLFAPAKPEHGDDLALIFAPVLDRFEQTYRNCQAAEAYALQLEQEAEQRRKAQQALSESERQLWMMVEFSPLAIAIFDREERTQYLNSKFIELFGFTPHDIPSLADWGRLAFADPEQYAETRRQWDAALRRSDDLGREVPTIRAELASKTGDSRLIEVRTKRFDGRIMMVLIDLEMEERLKRLPSSSSGAAEQRAEIVAGISQDLYTPLNAILGFAQLLEMEAADLEASIRDNVEQIVVAGRQLQAVIDRAVKSSLAEFDAPAAPESASSAPASRILVAEDYLPNQQLLARQLKRLGLEADFAENGARALALWQQHDYAVLLTDCNMPVMDGFELTAQIRAAEAGRKPRTPIIAITANTVGEEAERCRIVGMDDFLAKPVQLQELEQTLNRWLKHASAVLPPVGTGPAASRPVATAPTGKAAPSDEIWPAGEAGAAMSAGPGRDISLNRLAGLLGEDDPHEILRLLEIFSRSVEELMAEARSAGQAADMRTLAQAMHKLKSSARTIGAVDLAELAQGTELAAKASDWSRVEQLLPGLDAGVGQVVAQIRALLVAPLLEGVSQIQTGQVDAASQADLAGSDLARMGVLLVDDDAFIREQIAGMLRRLGIVNLRLAGEGGEALSLLDGQPGKVDLIITDLNMPGMDGVEFIRHLNTRKFAGNLIFISGEDSRVLSTVRELAESQGLHVLGTLTKPVVPATLFALMRQQRQARSKAAGGAGPQVSVMDVRHGIEQGEFTVFFQPKVNAASLEVIGVEALARWIRPGQGMVSPGVFIPLAEGNGLIEPLTMALLTRAIELCGELHRAGYPIKMAVNYSALAFGNLQVPEFIVEQTARAGIEPKHLIMEVTESGLMGDIAVALDVLTRLRLKGVNLSIDDFGTGYSSMDQLRRIPFSELKIDQGFVRGAATDRLSRSILESSVDMAKKLNLVTVAEGVETEEDLELVRSLGCDMIQGFYIAKPMALQDLLVWLAQRQAPAA